MKMRPFELALLVIFLVLLLGALFLLANYEAPPSDEELVSIKQPVVIWGTLPEEAVLDTLTLASERDESFSLVSYEYHAPEQFTWELVNALADGTGPDLVLMSHEMLVPMRKRIAAIPYETFPLADIQASYIDGAEIFALKDGMYAFPIGVDPLVMYWNRDIMSTNGYIQPPTTWEQLINRMFPDLIERDFNRTIRRSVVAMGEYGNVRNAFGAISMIMIQGGSALVSEGDRGYTIELDERLGGDGAPLQSAANFYTRFSQPSNTLYSWNRAQREDRSQFISEDLVFYFGYGSEGREIERLNPNLNFAVAEVPQSADATVRRTYGKFYGLSILSSSDNFNEALRVLYTLADQTFVAEMANDARIVPMYRNLVEQGSSDIYSRTAYLTAPVARGWLNPDINESNEIFATMVADINENRRSPSNATGDAIGRLRLAY